MSPNTLSFNSVLSLLISLLPVVAFLIALIVLDSYKLVRLRWVLYLILYGSVAAFVCLWVNTWIVHAFHIETRIYARYFAPIVEETFKASFLIYLIARRRIGFMVDASIVGFAIGAGFAIVENVYYFKFVSDPNLLLWIVRGFGTAVMHGGVTAIVGILSKYFCDRYGARRLGVFVLPMIFAIVVHSAFNHFFLPPLLSTIVLLVVLPLIVIVVFQASERGTRHWLGVRFDTDAELLEMINTGTVSRSRIGEYLDSLKSRFAGEVVADMVCLIRLHLELSIHAKGLLLMREAGFKAPEDQGVEERFEELKYLERSIGRTGLLAISPIFNMSDRDLWQLHMLGKR